MYFIKCFFCIHLNSHKSIYYVNMIYFLILNQSFIPGIKPHFFMYMYMCVYICSSFTFAPRNFSFTICYRARLPHGITFFSLWCTEGEWKTPNPAEFLFKRFSPNPEDLREKMLSCSLAEVLFTSGSTLYFYNVQHSVNNHEIHLQAWKLCSIFKQ